MTTSQPRISLSTFECAALSSRDRAPFVLTKDMAYVINGGERLGQRFQHFSELCCAAYNELRRHAHLIMSLLSLVGGAGRRGLGNNNSVVLVN